jgi:hypothetical protein
VINGQELFAFLGWAVLALALALAMYGTIKVLVRRRSTWLDRIVALVALLGLIIFLVLGK